MSILPKTCLSPGNYITTVKGLVKLPYLLKLPHLSKTCKFLMSIMVLVRLPDPFRVDYLNLEETILNQNEEREMAEEKERERERDR